MLKYLTDKEYSNDKNKKLFIQKIKDNCVGIPEKPDQMIEEGQKLSEEGLSWIEIVTGKCLNKPVNFKANKFL